MNIVQIKTKLDIPSLQLNPSVGADKQPDGWMRHWDNDTRTAVSLHKDTLAAIKADLSISSLALQTETRTAEQGEYTAHRIVMYTPAAETL